MQAPDFRAVFDASPNPYMLDVPQEVDGVARDRARIRNRVQAAPRPVDRACVKSRTSRINRPPRADRERAHSGTIAVRSTMDGTVFTVRLPRSVDRSSRVA